MTQCERAFEDKHHLFRAMWHQEARRQNHWGELACWDFRRDCNKPTAACRQAKTQFFVDVEEGRQCLRQDWYEGSTYAHGKFAFFEAPALLGFDDDIHRYCNNKCDDRNVNILNLFGTRVRYNSCRNFEWQACAAQGKLRGQGGNKIRFATAPKDLTWERFGVCGGWTDRACDSFSAFANDDIYYLEICLFSQVCRNREEIFTIEAGQDYRCQFDRERFRDLRDLLIAGSPYYST